MPEPDPTNNPPNDPNEPDLKDEPETFDAEYVHKLRAENADARTKRKAAEDVRDAALGRLWEAERARACAGILADPTDLEGTVDMLDDDGVPDFDRIKTAAEELAKTKPHLRPRKPTEPIDQGVRGEAEPVNLAAKLRQLAH
jgi:hypothetical protein